MDFSKFTAFECTLTDGLFHITLALGEQGNTFGKEFCNELNLIVNEISDRPDVRAVLMTSSGRFFSVGGDIGMMSGARDALPGIVKTMTSSLHVAITRLMSMNAPVVCAVHGRGTFGGAVALAAAADIVVAGAGAKFGSAFTGIGFSCDSGTTVALTQRLGVSRAKRFVLLGETLNAEEALAAGLIDFIAPEDEVIAQATAIATRLSKGPTLAFGEIKRLFTHANSRGPAAQMEEEAAALTRISRTADAWEGITSFKEKRAAKFSGM